MQTYRRIASDKSMEEGLRSFYVVDHHTPMDMPTKKVTDTFFAQCFLNQVNDFSNLLYYNKQLLQWLVKGVT